MVKKWLFILIVLVMVASTVFVSCADGTTPPPPPEKDPYVVGIAGSLTGPMAISYIPLIDGLRIYLEAVNDRGGINGRQVKILIEDSQSSPAEAAVAARKLTEMGAHILFGLDGSPTYGAYETEAKRAKVPSILGGVAPPRSLPPTPDPFVYSGGWGGSTAAVVSIGAYKLTQYGGEGSVAGVTTMDSPVMKMAGEGTIQLGKKYGLKDVVYRPIPTGTVDLTPIALVFKEAGAASAVNLGAAGHSLMLYDALMKIGWDGMYCMVVTDPVEILFEKYKGKENMALILVGYFPFQADFPFFADVKAAAEKYGVTDVTSQLTVGWELGMVVEEIFKRAGWPVTTDRLLEVMGDFEFKRPMTGTLKWNDDNHASNAVVPDYLWDKAKGEWVYSPPTLVLDAWGEIIPYDDFRDIP